MDGPQNQSKIPGFFFFPPVWEGATVFRSPLYNFSSLHRWGLGPARRSAKRADFPSQLFERVKAANIPPL